MPDPSTTERDAPASPRGFVPERPQVWLHDLYPTGLQYRWLQKNVRMRCDEHGVEVGYRPRRDDDVICGATTLRPGDPTAAKPPWWYPVDPSKPYEVGCTILGEHADTPHIGVPLSCAEQTCDCWKNGSYHLVITGMTIGDAGAPSVTRGEVGQ